MCPRSLPVRLAALTGLLLGAAALPARAQNAPPPAPPTENAMYVQFVRLSSALPDAEVRRIMEERAPQFRAVPGLLQKYYGRDPETGAYAGIYVWDSEASMRAFFETELRRTIPTAYEVTEPPRVERYEVLFPLHPAEPSTD